MARSTERRICGRTMNGSDPCTRDAEHDGPCALPMRDPLREALRAAIEALRSAHETRDGEVQVQLSLPPRNFLGWKRWVKARQAADELEAILKADG